MFDFDVRPRGRKRPVLVRAYNSAIDADVTGDGTAVTIEFDTEDVDRGGDFDTTTDTFRAPFTGIYTLSGVLILLGVTTHTSLALEVITSGGRNYTVMSVNPSALAVSTVVAAPWALANIPLTANDTLTLRVTVGGATKVVDIYGATDGTGTSFAAELVG